MRDESKTVQILVYESTIEKARNFFYKLEGMKKPSEVDKARRIFKILERIS